MKAKVVLLVGLVWFVLAPFCAPLTHGAAQQKPAPTTQSSAPAKAHVPKRDAPKAHAPKPGASKPAASKPGGPKANGPKPIIPPQGIWPVMMSIQENPTQFPAIVLKGFLNVGLLHETATPRTTFFMDELEVELNVHLSQWVRFEIAFQVVKETFNITQTPAAITLLDQLLQEAFVFIQLPKGFGILVGRYISYQGWEAQNTVDRLQVSGSFTFDMTSSTLTGAALRWEGKSAVIDGQIDLFLSNRWDQNNNALAQPSVGVYAMLKWKPSKAFAMTLAATPSYGIEPSVVEAALATTPIFSLSTNVLLEMFGGKWQIVGDLALATEPVSGKSHYALMAMTHFKVVDYLGFTLRYSRFHDIGNLLADPGAHNNEWSVAALFLPLKIKTAPAWSAPLRELRLLLEGRIDTVGFDANTIAARIQLSVIVPFKLIFQPAYRPGKVWK